MKSKLAQKIIIVLCGLLLHLFLYLSLDSIAAEQANIPLTKATPESQGLNGSTLEEAKSKIINGDYGTINSLLITRNNYLVFEEYFSKYNRDFIHPVNSVTKSITSALVGIAIHQDKIKSVHTKLMDFFPDYTEVKNMDSRKNSINLENILTMTSGFEWDEISIPYTNPNNKIWEFVNSADSIKYVLDLPMSSSPGSFRYNSGCTILLGGILENTCGRSVKDFAEDNLFKPLGITNYFWKAFPNGTTNTGWGLLMRPIDMARFGILFLNNGTWKGKQIVPKEWSHKSTQEHTKMGRLQYAYGYQWWRFLDNDPTVDELSINDIYFALGYGGQEIIVIPHLHMVVVSTAENYRKMEHFKNLLYDYIFPSVIE